MTRPGSRRLLVVLPIVLAGCGAASTFGTAAAVQAGLIALVTWGFVRSPRPASRTDAIAVAWLAAMGPLALVFAGTDGAPGLVSVVLACVVGLLLLVSGLFVSALYARIEELERQLAARPVAAPVVEAPHETQPSQAPVSATRPPAFRLAVLAGPAAGREYVFSERDFTIGRGSENTISVPDVSLSRRHVRLRQRDDGAFDVTDLDSRNGTRINSLPVRSGVIGVGDELTAGDTVLLLLEVEAIAPEPEGGEPEPPEEELPDATDTPQVATKTPAHPLRVPTNRKAFGRAAAVLAIVAVGGGVATLLATQEPPVEGPTPEELAAQAARVQARQGWWTAGVAATLLAQPDSVRFEDLDGANEDEVIFTTTTGACRVARWTQGAAALLFDEAEAGCAPAPGAGTHAGLRDLVAFGEPFVFDGAKYASPSLVAKREAARRAALPRRPLSRGTWLSCSATPCRPVACDQALIAEATSARLPATCGEADGDVRRAVEGDGGSLTFLGPFVTKPALAKALAFARKHGYPDAEACCACRSCVVVRVKK